KTRRFLLVKPVAASSVWHRAPVRAMTRGSPNRRAGALRPSASTEGARSAPRLGSQGRCRGGHVRHLEHIHQDAAVVAAVDRGAEDSLGVAAVLRAKMISTLAAG